MPRFSGKTPSYRKHRASGQAVVTLGGRDFYLGPWKSAASRAEYDRRIREWHVGGGTLAPDQRDELTIVELLAAFMRHAKDYYRDRQTQTPTGEYADYCTLAKRLTKAYGRTTVCDFGPLKFKAFRQSLVDTGNKPAGKPSAKSPAAGETRERPLCRTTINQTMNRLRHIVKWGVENELVKPSVFESLKCVAGLRFGKTDAKETEPIRPVPDAFVDAVLPFVAPQVAAMIELQRVTGMRSGEVCRMTMADISTSGDVWTYTPARHKTLYRGHSRVVYLGPKAQEVLRPWLRTNLGEYLFSPAEAEQARHQRRHAERKTPLSCGNKPGSNRTAKPRKSAGDCYTTSSYLRAVKYGIGRVNRERTRQGEPEIPSWHPHQLRHNAATYFRRQHGLEVARVLLGHKHAAITEVYAEADTARAVEVVAKIG